VKLPTILHIDMNSFFASVEQTANPFIRNKPVGVVATKNYENAAIVAASYPAKYKGVRSFMRLKEAKEKCPEIIAVPSDFLKYYTVNKQIVNIFREYTPLVEVYSIDEAFLDFAPVMKHLKGRSIEDIAQEIKDRIRAEVGSELTSSVGISANKLLAKVGSNWKKPDGLTVIPYEERFEYMDKLALQDVWGIGFRGGGKLEKIGIKTVKDLRCLDPITLRSIVGSYYTRLVALANGECYDPISPDRTTKLHKSMQHAHTLDKATSDKEELKSVIRKMSERLARRLRKHEQTAKIIYLGLRPEKQGSYGWGSLPHFSGFTTLCIPTDHGYTIYKEALKIFNDLEFGSVKIRLVAVGVADLGSEEAMVFDIFSNMNTKRLDKAVDEINDMYGGFTIRPGDIVYQYAKEQELSIDREDMTFHPASQ